MNYIDFTHLDIVGLSELYVTKSTITKHRSFTSHAIHEFFWAINNDNFDFASGCTLLIKKDIARHIQKTSNFKGRMITVDLFFKRFYRICIIHVYVPPTNQIQCQKELATKLRNRIKEGHDKNFKLIVLGNFNENMDAYINIHANEQSTNTYNYRFLNLMNHYNLINAQEHHTKAPYENTWQSSSRHSRIDGIYISNNLLIESFATIIDNSIRLHLADHACVITKFNCSFFFKRNNFFDRKNKKQTQHFQFDKMDSGKWKNFKKHTKLTLIEDAILIITNIPSLPSLAHINFINNKLEEILIKSAKATIPIKV